MRKAILLAVLIATVIIAGCAEKETRQPADNQPGVPAGEEVSAPTVDVGAIDSGANSVDTGLSDLDSTQAELDPGINDADLDLGI